MRSWRSQGKRQNAKGKSIRIALFAFFLLPFALASCALWREPAPAPAPDRPLQEASADELQALLREREEALRTVKGLFSARVEGPGLPIAQTIYGTLFYRRADALRLQGFDRFGGRVFDFVLEPSQYHLRLPNDDRRLTGRPSDLARSGGLSESVRLSVLAMSGVLGVAAITPGASTSLAEEGDVYRLDVRYPAAMGAEPAPLWRQLWFDRRTLYVVRERRFTPEGDLAGTLEMGDFRVMETPQHREMAGSSLPRSLMLPHSVRATSGDGKAEIDITFSELHPNIPLQEKDLRLAAEQAPGLRESHDEAAGG